MMRCLALAQAWQDAGGRALLATVSPSPSIKERLLKESIAILEVCAAPGTDEDAVRTVALAREHAATWVAVDGYQFGGSYQRTLKSEGIKTLFLDDYGHAEHYSADVVLNQNVGADSSAYDNRESYTQLLLGPKYCLLRREFIAWQEWRRETAHEGHRVLVTMGGSDPENFTEKAIHGLNLIEDGNLEAAVVAGGSNARSALLETIAAKGGKKIGLRCDVSNMAELMAWADVAVSAAGTTCWEICLMGLPALLTDLAENQTPVARELDRRGCAIYLGSAPDVSPGNLAEHLKRLLSAQDIRQAMSSSCHELVDGKGARRVVSALRSVKLRLRPAEQNDSRLLWEWANDSQVRNASFSSVDIPWTTHVAWMAEKLQQDGCRILIAEDDAGTPVGQIRFTPRGNGDTEINLSIARAWRGQGLANALIKQAARSVLYEGYCSRIHAFVKPENVASVKAFETSGFKRVGMDEVKGNAAVHFIYEEN